MTEDKAEGAIARPLTETDLDSLEKLLSGASDGPWQWMTGDTLQHNGLYLLDGDAALCAALRNLAPALLEEVKSLRSWRKEAEGLLREAREGLRHIDFVLGEENYGGRYVPTYIKQRLQPLDAFLGAQ